MLIASALIAPSGLSRYRRLFYVRVLLKANLNVLLCDVDIILLKNPMPHFTRNFELYGVMEIQEDIHGKDTETVQLERGSAMYLNAGEHSLSCPFHELTASLLPPSLPIGAGLLFACLRKLAGLVTPGMIRS